MAAGSKITRSAFIPGLLRPGMKADLLIFDPATIADPSVYEQAASILGRGARRDRQREVRDAGLETATPDRPGRIVYGPAKQ